MTCDREKLSYYVDGELDPDEVRQLQQHLADCEQCRADLAAYREVDDVVGRLDHKRTPSELRRQIYHKVEERRRARGRWGWAGPLLGPAAPLTVGIVLATGGVVVWRSLPPGSAPVMTAAFTVQESPDSLDGLRVELVFDRPLAAESVAQAITIEPPLSISQRVHENKVELVPDAPVPPDTSYRVTVSNVRDQRGNVQSEPVVFNLMTGPTARLVQESRPVEVPTAATPLAATKVAQPTQAAAAVATSTAPPAATAVVEPPTAAMQSGAPRTQTPASTATGVRATTTTGQGAPAASIAGPTSTLAPTLVAATPTAAAPTTAPTSATVAPTATAGFPAAAARPPSGGLTGLPPTAPPPTPTLDAVAARPQPPVTATALPSSNAGVLESSPELQNKLGAATLVERPTRVGEQSFQGGLMLARADTNLIYVLIRSTGRWLSFPNTWRPGEVLPPAGSRPPGTFEPLRGFGKVWRDQPSVKLQLGWPVYEEQTATGAVQVFQRGDLIRPGSGVAYALFDDGTWRALADPRR